MGNFVASLEQPGLSETKLRLVPLPPSLLLSCPPTWSGILLECTPLSARRSNIERLSWRTQYRDKA